MMENFNVYSKCHFIQPEITKVEHEIVLSSNSSTYEFKKYPENILVASEKFQNDSKNNFEDDSSHSVLKIIKNNSKNDSVISHQVWSKMLIEADGEELIENNNNWMNKKNDGTITSNKEENKDTTECSSKVGNYDVNKNNNNNNKRHNNDKIVYHRNRNNNIKKARELMQDLLTRIYGSDSANYFYPYANYSSTDMKDTAECSTDSACPFTCPVSQMIVINKNLRTRVSKEADSKWNEAISALLSKKCTAELKELKSTMKYKINCTGNQLVKHLKKRDLLSRKRDSFYHLITAYLQAQSMKTKEDAKIQFSMKPNNGESGFYQWHSAMKMVARLPGGVPQEFRKTLWLALSERYVNCKSNMSWDAVEKMCFNDSTNPDDIELGVQIVKDLHRTGCSLFCGSSGEENQAVLKRVLLAYARWNKTVGYCQGFNMLAALILQVTDRSEVDSLKVMIYLIEGILPESYFGKSMRGLSIDMIVFRDLLRSRLPDISKHLEQLQTDCNDSGASYEPPLTNVFTMQWFLTLFCNCLPQSTVLRVWDLIFLEGNSILLKTALVIWDALSERIKSVNSADEFYSIMAVITREMLEFGLMDSNSLIKTICNIDLPELIELREKYTYNIHPWSQVAKKGLRLFYNDEDTDDESDDDDDKLSERAYNFLKCATRQGSQSMKNISPTIFGPFTMDKDRLALDISTLKRQYCKIRERHRQARIIFTAACTGEGLMDPLSQRVSTPPINHLLVGRTVVKTNKELTSSRSSFSEPNDKVDRGETIHWGRIKEESKINMQKGEKGKENEDIPHVDTSIGSNLSSSSSSTSTELCDETGDAEVESDAKSITSDFHLSPVESDHDVGIETESVIFDHHFPPIENFNLESDADSVRCEFRLPIEPFDSESSEMRNTISDCYPCSIEIDDAKVDTSDFHLSLSENCPSSPISTNYEQTSCIVGNIDNPPSYSYKLPSYTKLTENYSEFENKIFIDEKIEICENPISLIDDINENQSLLKATNDADKFINQHTIQNPKEESQVEFATNFIKNPNTLSFKVEDEFPLCKILSPGENFRESQKYERGSEIEIQKIDSYFENDENSSETFNWKSENENFDSNWSSSVDKMLQEILEENTKLLQKTSQKQTTIFENEENFNNEQNNLINLMEEEKSEKIVKNIFQNVRHMSLERETKIEILKIKKSFSTSHLNDELLKSENFECNSNLDLGNNHKNSITNSKDEKSWENHENSKEINYTNETDLHINSNICSKSEKKRKYKVPEYYLKKSNLSNSIITDQSDAVNQIQNINPFPLKGNIKPPNELGVKLGLYSSKSSTSCRN